MKIYETNNDVTLCKFNEEYKFLTLVVVFFSSSPVRLELWADVNLNNDECLVLHHT